MRRFSLEQLGLGSKRLFTHRLLLLAALCAVLVWGVPGRAQEESATADGGASYDNGQEFLESIFVPYMPNAPFSMMLSTEWSKPMANGGHYVTINLRPIKRDSAGRIYQERWLLVPKGSGIQSRMSWIQIANPVDHTLLQCSARQHLCEMVTLRDRFDLRMRPDLYTSAPLRGGKGFHTHEDLGIDVFLGLTVHHYRETTTLNPGTMGNDLAMVTVRDFRFSEPLGLSLSSVLDTPSLGQQSFKVTEITTTEPDPRFFLPPDGYRVIDHRTPVAPKP